MKKMSLFDSPSHFAGFTPSQHLSMSTPHFSTSGTNQNLFSYSTLPVNKENEKTIPCGENNSPLSAFSQINTDSCNSLIFRKNVPFLYMGYINYHLVWPSLTVEFMPKMSFSTKNVRYNSNGEVGFCAQKVLFGTHTSKNDVDYVFIGELKFPLRTLYEDPLRCENYEGYVYNNRVRTGNNASTYLYGGSTRMGGQNVPHFEIKAKLVHPGEVNRAACMPQNPFYIATKNAYGNVLFFDYSKHPSVSNDTRVCKPEVLLNGHLSEGYGLAWNPITHGLLASCCSEGKVCIWNIDSFSSSSGNVSSQLSTFHNYGKNNFLYKNGESEGSSDTYYLELGTNVSSLDPVYSWKVDHTNDKKSLFSSSLCATANSSPFSLNDIQWLPTHRSILCTACETGSIDVWDLRSNCAPSSASKTVHTELSSAVNTLSFNLYNEHVFASGHVNGCINIYDLRNLKKQMCTLVGHTDCINKVEWSPACSAVVASCSNDGLAILWDVSKCSYAKNKVDHCSNGNVSFNKENDDSGNKSESNKYFNKEGADNKLCGEINKSWECGGNENLLTKTSKMKKKKNVPCIRRCVNNNGINNSTSDNLNDDRKEILFVHAGHDGPVYDFSWSKSSNTKWLISTVGDDNSIQAWQIAEHFLLR